MKTWLLLVFIKLSMLHLSFSFQIWVNLNYVHLFVLQYCSQVRHPQSLKPNVEQCSHQSCICTQWQRQTLRVTECGVHKMVSEAGVSLFLFTSLRSSAGSAVGSCQGSLWCSTLCSGLSHTTSATCDVVMQTCSVPCSSALSTVADTSFSSC